MTTKKALLVVDLQNDFCQGGALPVKDGDEIVAPTNRLIASFEKANLPILFTRDWHPKAHCSFREQGGQWPPHCVQNTRGAEFNPSLVVPAGAVVISKATRKGEDAYSGFQGTDLAQQLRHLGVKELVICGLATDYCVKETVLDAINLGFQADVVTDCIKGVNLERTDSETAIGEMVDAGARMVSSDELVRELRRSRRDAGRVELR